MVHVDGKRIVRRAGVEPWSNPFRNLRSTRETELALEHPLHIVCEWIGNTPSVAMSNYLRVTDADYERALTKDSALQNALQQPAAGGRKASQPEMTNPGKPADCKALRTSAARCERPLPRSVVSSWGFSSPPYMSVCTNQPTDGVTTIRCKPSATPPMHKQNTFADHRIEGSTRQYGVHGQP